MSVGKGISWGCGITAGVLLALLLAGLALFGGCLTCIYDVSGTASTVMEEMEEAERAAARDMDAAPADVEGERPGPARPSAADVAAERAAREKDLAAKRVAREKRDYRQSLQLYDLKAKYYTSSSRERVPGVEFKLRNRGKRTLTQVEVTVYFRDAGRNVICEEHYFPVLVSSYSLERSTPLKPGYIWQMEKGTFYPAKKVPDEWREGSVLAKITDIEFASD